ncbi:hypothetical protein DL93DRAFT_2165473 [Clavulina sp. PMI_390]|nr:hypothetical protein DL93DRAFT_2165473 [Clavulina sp. PMI_390]
MDDEHSRFPIPYSDLRKSGIEAELEPFLDTASESTGSYLSTDPGRVGTDFDAQMTTSGDYGFTPHQGYKTFGRSVPGSRAGRSTRSYPHSYIKSPLQNATVPEELSSDLDEEEDEDDISDTELGPIEEQTPDTARYLNTPPLVDAPPPPEGAPAAVRQTVSPFGPYHSPTASEKTASVKPRSQASTVVPPVENRLSLTEQVQETSMTPRASMEVAPPIEAERTRKLVAAINVALDWARTLTENDTTHVTERDAVLAILYVINNRLQQGVPSRHVPLFRALHKTVKQLTAWCQEVVSHRDQYDWPVISVTLRGFIQKLRDFNNSLTIDSDPATIALQLNAKIAEHNAQRAESEAIRQALKQKLREEKLARREERAQIRQMHAQLTMMKRAQKEGIELTERLGGMVSREAIKAAPDSQVSPPEATVTARSAGPATLDAEMRSVLTGDDDDDDIGAQPRPLSEPPSLSSLGQIIPGGGSTRRGPGAASDASIDRGQTPLSNDSTPRRAGRSRDTTQNRLSSIASVPSSKPLPHRPFSRTEEDLRSEADQRTDIVEEQIEINGDRAPSISFIPRKSPAGSYESASRHRRGDSPAVDIPASPRSNAGGIPPPPIHVSPSLRAPSKRSGSNTPPANPRQSQASGKRRSQPPEYQYPSAEDTWKHVQEWKEDVKEKEKMLFGDDRYPDAELEAEEDSAQAEQELLAAFNRVVNLDNPARGAMIDQRAEPRAPIHPNEPVYPHRAYQAPPETISHVLGVDEDVDYPDLTRSGTPPASVAYQYRQNQVRSQPPQRGQQYDTTEMDHQPSTDNSALPLTEHELDEPVEPYPMMNEHGWMKTNAAIAYPPSMDENYMISPEYGVRVRRYDDGEQPGILEMLHPVPPPPLPQHGSSNSRSQSRGSHSHSIPQQTQSHSHPSSQTSRPRESSHSSSRSPKIFAAIAEQAAQENRERARPGSGLANGGATGNGHSRQSSSAGYRNAYGWMDVGSGQGYGQPPVDDLDVNETGNTFGRGRMVAPAI